MEVIRVRSRGTEQASCKAAALVFTSGYVSNQTGTSTTAGLVPPPPIGAATSIGYVQPVTVLTRRRLIALSAGIALAPGRSACAQMQPLEWPNRVVRLIVPFAAGGPTDIVARNEASGASALDAANGVASTGAGRTVKFRDGTVVSSYRAATNSASRRVAGPARGEDRVEVRRAFLLKTLN